MSMRLFSKSGISAVALVAAAPLLAVSTVGFAHGTSQSPQARQSSESASEVTTPPHADIQSFESAKLSLTQALTESQNEMRGTPISARFEIWHGEPSYLIRTLSSNQVWQGRVDANTGQPIGQPMAIPKDKLTPELQKDVASLGNVQTNLTEAVSKAEQTQGGKAIMAAVRSHSPGSAGYRVALVKNRKLHVAMIDAQSGQVQLR